mgnify:FL=1
MSTAKRGRRVAPRRAAIQRHKKQSKRLNALLGIAGIGVTLTTAGSAIGGLKNPGMVDLVASGKSEVTVARAKQVPVRETFLNRVRAASRSQIRDGSDIAALNAAASEPDTSVTQSGELTAADRQALKVFASDSSQLSTIVDDTQQEIDYQLAAQARAEKAAAKEAARKAQIKLESQYSTSGNVTYPQEVGGPSSQYNAPIPTTAQLADRLTPLFGGYQLSARFGERGWIWSTGWHTGLDFVVPTGTRVRAAASGTIINAGWAGAYGNRIEVDCGDGYIVTYNHLSRIEKFSGPVKAGEEIGRSGATGNITGPHLHFEVLYNGKFVNPAVWLWGARH